jgi:hypothetical protein
MSYTFNFLLLLKDAKQKNVKIRVTTAHKIDQEKLTTTFTPIHPPIHPSGTHLVKPALQPNNDFQPKLCQHQYKTQIQIFILNIFLFIYF